MSWNGSNQSKSAISGPGGQTPSAKSDNLGLTYIITFTVVVAVVVRGRAVVVTLVVVFVVTGAVVIFPFVSNAVVTATVVIIGSVLSGCSACICDFATAERRIIVAATATKVMTITFFILSVLSRLLSSALCLSEVLV